MPEQITKYPNVTLEVLKGAGAVCGKGAPQCGLAMTGTSLFRRPQPSLFRP